MPLLGGSRLQQPFQLFQLALHLHHRCGTQLTPMPVMLRRVHAWARGCERVFVCVCDVCIMFALARRCVFPVVLQFLSTQRVAACRLEVGQTLRANIVD